MTPSGCAAGQRFRPDPARGMGPIRTPNSLTVAQIGTKLGGRTSLAWPNIDSLFQAPAGPGRMSTAPAGAIFVDKIRSFHESAVS